MNNKGQAAIEFIMLILIIIIYLLTVTRPLVTDAKDLTGDVQRIVRADAESKRIANSITEVSMLGQGTKKTLNLFIPENTLIECSETKNAIYFDLNFDKLLLSPLGPDCDGEKNNCCEQTTCRKTYIFPEEISLTCTKDIMAGETELIIINDNVENGTAFITLTG
jgi:hypothetical protein